MPALTTSRINRLLRPLHNKCASLALQPFSSPVPAATYASRSNANNWDAPSLALFPTPKVVGMRALLDKAAAEALEASKCVYAVTDCFQRLVQSVLDDGGDTNEMKGHRMPSLSAICATIVGESLNSETAPDLEASPDDNVEAEMLEEINQLYECVPLQHRRWTLVSHAVSIILQTCPHTPTLLFTLLSVVLTHAPDLVREAEQILHVLFSLTLTSNSTPPPITHPAHSSYLAHLRATWTAHAHTYYTDRSFTRLLADALKSAENAGVWTCKAVHMVALELRARDFTSFAYLSTALSEAVMALASEWAKKKAQLPSPEDMHAIRGRLNLWLRLLFDGITSDEHAQPVEHITIAMEFLLSARNLGLHTIPLTPQPLGKVADRTVHADLQTSLICLATYILASHHDLDTTGEGRHLVDILREVTPKPSTYTQLIAHVFNRSTGDSMQSLQAYASALREQSLLRCEASLWKCALTHLDLELCSGIVSGRAASKSGENLGLRLMELVEDAERRCFGNSDAVGEDGLTDGRQPTAELKGEYEWEEMVGSWIRRSPICASKTKRPEATIQRRSQTGRTIHLNRNHNERFQISRASRTARTFSISSKRPRYVPLSSPQSDDSGDDKENVQLLSSPTRLALKPIRVMNFRSLISDALKNRSALHPHKHRPSLTKSLSVTPRRASSSSSLELDRTDLSSDDEGDSTVLPSDDGLDLFAYVGSSPVAPRR